MTRRAPRPHLNVPSVGELRTILGCIGRVLRDSERTMDIVTAEELTAQAQLRYLLGSDLFDSAEGRALMTDRPDLETVDLDHLRALPAHTLGGALARFMDDNGLSTDLYGVPAHYTEDPAAAWLMRRIRQSHDIWHVLMGFGIRGHEEILVHAFSLAQTGLPSSIMLLLLGSVKHMLLEARFGCLLRGLSDSYTRGLAAAPLLAVYWERHWEEPLASVRARLGVAPWTETDHAACEPWALAA